MKIHDTLVTHGTYLGVIILLFKPRSVPSFSLVFPGSWFLQLFWLPGFAMSFGIRVNIFDIFGFGFLL